MSTITAPSRRSWSKGFTPAFDAPNKEQLKKDCDALWSAYESNIAQSDKFQSQYDRQKQFVSAVQASFADNYSQEGKELLNDFMMQGIQMAVSGIAGPFGPAVSQGWEAVQNAGNGDGGAVAATINIAASGYFLTNAARPSIYRSPTFGPVSRVNASGWALAASIAITVGKHMGGPMINESRQSDIMAAYNKDLAGLMTQSATHWVKGENALKDWKAKGCDKL